MPFKLIDGERPLQQAPVVKLERGVCCIPQQYLKYDHSLATIQKIILDCSCDSHFPIFVSEDNGCPYIQIGVIGFDNYVPRKRQVRRKIVYGRKWRVEPNLPTSEIVQTVFLAIQKAREHEIRELFKLRVNGKQSTPFSTHQDLPLMSRYSAHLIKQGGEHDLHSFTAEVKNLRNLVSFDNCSIQFTDIVMRTNGQVLVDCQLHTTRNTYLAESDDSVFSIILDKLCINSLLYELMAKFIERSNRYIEENFTYKNFKRFSRVNDVQHVGKLSVDTRNKTDISNQEFFARLENYNYVTDKTRVPQLYNKKFTDLIKTHVSRFGELDGILPYKD